MALQQEPTSVEVDPRRYMTMLHGLAGIGKTSWGAQIDGHYFMITESGIEGVSVYGEVVSCWEDFITVCKNLIAGKNKNWEGMREIKTAVIDTFEKLYDYAGEYICETQTFLDNGKPVRFKRIEDVTWGKGYKRLNNLVLRSLNQLALAGFGILLLGHSKKIIKKWRGQDLTHMGPNLPPTCAEALIGACGAVGHAFIEEELKKDERGEIVAVNQKRLVQWSPSFLIDAKHRLEHFPDQLDFPIHTGYELYAQTFKEAYAKGQTVPL